MSRPYRTIRGVGALLTLLALASGAPAAPARAQEAQPRSATSPGPSPAPASFPATSPSTAPAASTSPLPSPLPSPPPASASQPAGESPLLRAVQGSIARLEQAKGLDEKVKAKALDIYQQALSQLRDAQAWAARAEGFQKAAAEAPARLTALMGHPASASAPPSAPAKDLAKVPLPQLEARASQATAELAEDNKAFEAAAAEPQRRTELRLEIAKASAAAQKRLDDAGDQRAPAPAGEDPEVTAARGALLAAQAEEARQETQAYRDEVRQFDAELGLLSARYDAATQRRAQAREVLTALQAEVNRRRAQEAEQAADKAQKEAAAHPALRQLGGEVAGLARQRTGPHGLAAKIEQAATDEKQASAALADVDAQFHNITQKVRISGMTSAVCSLMRKERRELPDAPQYLRRISRRQEEISNVQLELINLEEQRSALADVRAQAGKVVGELRPPVEANQEARVQEVALGLLQAKRDNLDAIIKDTNTYFTALVDLDTEERRLVAQTQDFATYIDERILWFPSVKPFSLADLPYALEAARWIANPEAWVGVGESLLRGLRQRPVPISLGLAALCAFLARRRKILNRLQRVGRAVQDRTADTFLRTAEAMGWTLVLALPVPVCLWLLAGTLDTPDAFSAAVARGLTTAALAIGTLQFFRQLCRPWGLGQAHFGWPAESLRVTRKALRLLLLVSTPVLFVVAMLGAHGDETWRSSLGRLALSVHFVVLAIVLHRLLRPAGPVVQLSARTGLLYRARHLWHPLALAVPICALGLSWAGYALTAGVLSQRMIYTFLLLALELMILAGVRRAATLGLRRLTLWRSRRAPAPSAAGASPAQAAGAAPPGILAPPPPSQAPHGEPAPAPGAPQAPGAAGPSADPDAELLAARSRIEQLVRFLALAVSVLIVWWVWAPILSALGILRYIRLWEAGPTLADVALAVVVVALTYVVDKNVPSLTDVLILRRLRLDAGGRYAVRAVLRYAIGFVGGVLALGLLGLSWASVQWLVAAMTVGLGFGLQEIFANFVSGLIILFERPIRLGDTVTIGDVTGTVTRMRIRATTVTDWNRRDLIVPNKDFITGKVINWTLTDRLFRLVLPVPLPGNWDVEKAESLLLGIARKHPLVLRSPPPTVVLSVLGDNVMKFDLGVFIQGTESLLQSRQDQVRHELNMAIEKAFREQEASPVKAEKAGQCPS